MFPNNLNWLKGKSLELLIESYSSTARTIQVRGFTGSEQISLNHTTTGNRGLTSQTVALSDVPVVVTAAVASGSVRRGETYIRISLRVEGSLVVLLACGYVTSTSQVAWPFGKNESSIEGPGFMRTIVGTDPAAGEEIFETVPTGALWRLKQMRLVLVTTAVVGTRTPRLQFDQSSAVFWFQATIGTTSTSSTGNYSLVEGGTRIATANGNSGEFMPLDNRLSAGVNITTDTLNLAPGDDYAAPVMVVEEWLEA